MYTKKESAVENPNVGNLCTCKYFNIGQIKNFTASPRSHAIFMPHYTSLQIVGKQNAFGFMRIQSFFWPQKDIKFTLIFKLLLIQVYWFRVLLSQDMCSSKINNTYKINNKYWYRIAWFMFEDFFYIQYIYAECGGCKICIYSMYYNLCQIKT